MTHEQKQTFKDVQDIMKSTNANSKLMTLAKWCDCENVETLSKDIEQAIFKLIIDRTDW